MHLEGIEKIYVLNVESFSARRRHMEQELKRFHLEAEFVHAWDVPALTEDILKRTFKGQSLSLPQKSIALKHVTVLQNIVQNNYDKALILEDDVLFSDDFRDGVRRSLIESKSYPESQVIFIGCGGNFYTPKSRRTVGQSLYVNTRGRFADSYIIGRQSAQLRLDWISKNLIDKPIDNQFEFIDNKVGITILWLENPVVEQGSKTGLFRTSLEPAPPKVFQKIKFAYEKIRRKYLYQLWK